MNEGSSGSDLDAEIDAMSRVSSALSPLEEEARGRVLRWASERFGVAIGSDRRSDRDADDAGEDPEGEDVAKDNTYTDFADLVSDYAPRTDVDRALVAGYWFQVVQGQPTFQGAEVNRALTNLGHALGNVTDALSSNMSKKPQLVLQVGKTGRTKQARKTYKLSAAGVQAVKARLG